MNWEIIYSILALFSIIIYCLLIMTYLISWKRLRAFTADNRTFVTKVSIVIAARNEEENIIGCLNSVADQDYPVDLVEVIVIDDHSEDNTAKEVEQFIEQHGNRNIRLIRRQNDGPSKKKSLAQAIEFASGELVVLTDADCYAGQYWIRSIASFYEKFRPEMILGPVAFHREKNIFQKMQSLEFFSLIGSTAAAAALGDPIMCNGANLAFRKADYDDFKGFSGIDHTASGDDVFLMLKFKRRNKKGIRFIKSLNATVFTNASPDLRTFWNQRKRWTSKSPEYNDISITGTALVVYFAAFFTVVSLVLAIFNYYFLILFAALVILKSIIDFCFLYSVTSFFRRRKLMNYFIIEQVPYIFYVFVMGVAGNFSKYEWKGRRAR